MTNTARRPLRGLLPALSKPGLFALGALLSAMAVAQAPVDWTHPDSLKPSCALDGSHVEELYAAAFSKIIDPASNTNIGNYAALDLKETSATFGTSKGLRDGSILAVKASGGVSDGVASIWKQRKLSSAFSADVQYHLLQNKSSISADADSCAAHRRRMLRLNAAYAMAYDSIQRRLDSVDVQQAINKDLAAIDGLEKQIAATADKVIALARIKAPYPYDPAPGDSTVRDTLMRRVALIAGKADAALIPPAVTLDDVFLQVIPRLRETYAARKDSLSRTMQTKRLQLKQRRKELAFLLEETRPELLARLWSGYVQDRDALFSKLQPEGVALGWLSFGYGFVARRFKLFNDSAARGEQVRGVGYGSHELRLQYCRYKRDLFPGQPAFFFTSGVALGLTDNKDELEELSIEERVQQGPDTASLTVLKAYTALRGAYRKDLLSARFFADLYLFLGRGRNNALHLFPSYSTRQSGTPSLDIGMGFLAGHVQRDKPSNSVNVELFLLFNDVGDAASASTTLWQRSDLGLRVSFPFNFPQRP